MAHSRGFLRCEEPDIHCEGRKTNPRNSDMTAAGSRLFPFLFFFPICGESANVVG